MCAGLQAADLKVTPIQRDGRVFVSFELADAFLPDVRDAIHAGLPTTFSYRIDVRRAATSWFDRTVASVTISASVTFDNLTRRYQLSRVVDGRTQDVRPTEDESAVREWLTVFEQIPIASAAALELNGEYYVRIRANAQRRNAWFFLPWDREAILGQAKFTFIP
jgi:hypothetical protein